MQQYDILTPGRHSLWTAPCFCKAGCIWSHDDIVQDLLQLMCCSARLKSKVQLLTAASRAMTQFRSKNSIIPEFNQPCWHQCNDSTHRKQQGTHFGLLPCKAVAQAPCWVDIHWHQTVLCCWMPCKEVLPNIESVVPASMQWLSLQNTGQKCSLCKLPAACVEWMGLNWGKNKKNNKNKESWYDAADCSAAKFLRSFHHSKGNDLIWGFNFGLLTFSKFVYCTAAWSKGNSMLIDKQRLHCNYWTSDSR